MDNISLKYRQFYNELAVLRHYARDINSIIYSNDDIMAAYNSAINELCIRTDYFETINIYPIPPDVTAHFVFPWEQQNLVNLGARQAMVESQSDGMATCFPWEAAIWLNVEPSDDRDTMVTTTWESYMTENIVFPMSFPLSPFKVQSIKSVFYDNKLIDYISEEELMKSDPAYKTCIGEPSCYYLDSGGAIVLYPIPTSVQWDDDNIMTSPFDTFDDDGGIVSWISDHLDYGDCGIVTDSVNSEYGLAVIYRHVLYDIADLTDFIPVVSFLIKYIRYGTLERLFGYGKNFQPGLRDYWAMRKEAGIKAIKLMYAMKYSNRDYQMDGVEYLRKTMTRNTWKLMEA